MSDMKKLIIIYIQCIFFILINSNDLLSGQNLKIEKIDARSAYPHVKIVVTARSDPKTHPLDEQNLTIYEDGDLVNETIKITGQTDSVDQSHLVISIDSSKSISKKFMADIKSAAEKIVRRIGTKDKIALFRFNDDVTLLNDFSSDASMIIKNIDGVTRHGKKTLLYNAMYDSIDLIEKIKQSNKKILIFTDGRDEGSCVNVEDIITFARNEGIPVFFVCNKKTDESAVLARISMLTNGKLAYSSSQAQMDDMVKAVLSVKKNSYIINYKTHLTPDDAKHKIEVRLKQGAFRDRDVVFVKLKKEFIENFLFLSDRVMLICFVSLLCVTLLITIIFFLHRENKLLKDRFEIEKKLMVERSYTSAFPEIKESGPYRGQFPAEPENPESLYSKAWLYQKDALEKGKKYAIHVPEITVGSDENNHIASIDDTVSNYHAKIKYVDGAYHLFDLMSERGTYLNGKKLLRPKKLCDWDEIKVGKTILIFRGL